MRLKGPYISQTTEKIHNIGYRKMVYRKGLHVKIHDPNKNTRGGISAN